MVSAVILVNTNLDSLDKVIESLKHVEGVEEAHGLYGVYDFLIKIIAIFIDKIKDLIKFHIKQL